jgi:hypothetical protein
LKKILKDLFNLAKLPLLIDRRMWCLAAQVQLAICFQAASFTVPFTPPKK